MTTGHAPTLDTTAVVEVRLTLSIPNDAELYETHDANTNDRSAIQAAVLDEVTSWMEGLGCTVSSANAEVLAI